MTTVKIDKVTKYFGKVRAFEDISLEVRNGEFLTLLGPSGCGKTTLLRCIAGLETPTSGHIYIDGQLVDDIPPKDRDVSMVFQSYALFPHMSVRENIGFPLKMRKVPKADINNDVKDVAKLLQISELLDRRPKKLSGGQMQRVALGRALVRRPNVFLMDEPLSNLDAKLRIYMRAELKALQEKLGITTIYVTHDQVEAMTMSARIAILNKGYLQQIARPGEIYKNPESVFVGGFMGNPPMNFLACVLVRDRTTLLLTSPNFRLDVTDLFVDFDSSLENKAVLLGIRPEDMKISKKPIVSNSIKSQVYVIEPLGSQVLVTLLSGDNMIKVIAPPDFQSTEKEKVWISVSRKKIHIFNKDTEKMIV